jgi:hypothetical protein
MNKATVINVYDEQGNEIKNVSTEIVLNGETYVKKEADKQPDYSHLVGMWVKCIKQSYNPDQIDGKYYKCVGIEERDKSLIVLDEHGVSGDYGWRDPERLFDIKNPKSHNPDTVVGLKELPNDGKTYAECLEDVVFESLGVAHFKGLFYPYSDRGVENPECPEASHTKIIGHYTDFTSHFRIHTPAKPIWETCREGMWKYNPENIIITPSASTIPQDESIKRNLKHYNASSYLSEVARRCNGDRVVDWMNSLETKYTIDRNYKAVVKGTSSTWYREIVFLDKEARDHSFEVDEHIWNDYYGLPNE